MRKRTTIYRLRSAIAALLGVSAKEASNGTWWETDFILVIFFGAAILGVAAWL